MQWYLDVLRKYAVFSGRAGRPEFWYFVLFNAIIEVVGEIIGARVGIVALLLALYGLAVLLPSIGVAIRRLHDVNRSGWWLLIGLVPIIGGIILIIWYASSGTPGPNRYGDTAPTSPAAAAV